VADCIPVDTVVTSSTGYKSKFSQQITSIPSSSENFDYSNFSKSSQYRMHSRPGKRFLKTFCSDEFVPRGTTDIKTKTSI